MTRPAPAATRALAILDLLAAHPTQSFTLSEIARELGINLASTHAVLGTMTDAGYLVRHPTHKTYRLGPSTMAVGNAALVGHPVIGAARLELQRLSDETGLECTASAPLEDAIVAVVRTGPSTRQRPLISLGQRMPLIPPLGIMFLAWSEEERVERWLAETPAAETARYRQVMASARALGYSVGINEGEVVRAVPPVPDDPGSLDLDPDLRYQVVYIASSTFDEHGAVSLVINLAGFPRRLSVGQIEKFGLRLGCAAAAITEAVHGRHPSGRRPSL